MYWGTYSKQMTNTHRQTNGQSRRTLQVFPFVITGSEHSEDQLKGDEDFNNQGISYRYICIHL